ncbi:sugar O-acetyltransferase [Photobacterium minamisatsumaniensis]|uniref:sugar O-acetyltransferase n=1 Tax=Photobacterium minamisatsumaniensis TaxID=2910233 RepID=UPI003D0A8BF7
MTKLTEKQKLLAGIPYISWDEELTEDRSKAKKLCFQISQTCPTDRKSHQELLSQIIGYSTDAWVEPPFYCDYGYNIKLGSNFYSNHGCVILDGAAVSIGDNCLFGPNVVIATPGHPLDPVARARGDEYAKAITIGHDVWLGANVSVCPGVTIGDNVVVGAGSVVVKDLPSNSVCVGSPAVAIRAITENDKACHQ